MRGSRVHLPFVLALALSGLPIAASAAIPASPRATLAAMCRAEGGARWLGIAGISDAATVRSDGLTGTERDLTDLRTGRELAEERYAMYVSGSGIDADGAWSQGDSGQVHSLDSAEADKLAATDRWLARRGYCHLQDSPATLQSLAPVTRHGIAYDRIAATPPHGRTVTLWIGPDHRLARTSMLNLIHVDATRYGDYRDVQGIELPFRVSTDVGKTHDVTVATVQHYRLLREIPAKALQRPGNAVTDARIAGGKTGTTVPFTYGNGHLLIEARIDGKGPFPFVLDTGGHAILTPATVKRLGLKTRGAGLSYGAGAGGKATSYTRVAQLRIGNAEIEHPSFLVLPLSSVMTDLGNRPPVAGILGFEVFARFAVTLDFADREMTLQTFASATPPRGARTLPIQFTQDMPLVKATLDGKPGIFGVDTGNSGPLPVFPQWAAREGLARYYLAGMPAPGSGQGGQFMTHAAWIRSLALAGLRVPADEPAALTAANAGAASIHDEAGNLGLRVWKHFTVEFDYRRGAMYLTPRPDFALPQPAASDGLAAIKLAHDAFTIMGVMPDGPAAKAGLKRGEKVVSVDGTPASHLASLWLMLHPIHEPPGTHLDLVLASGRKADVVLGSRNAAIEKALHPDVH